jgi:hypothetical protein
MNFQQYLSRLQSAIQQKRGDELTNLLPWKDLEQVPTDIIGQSSVNEIQTVIQQWFANEEDCMLMALYIKFTRSRDFESFFQIITYYNSTRKMLIDWLIPLTRAFVKGIVSISTTQDLKFSSKDARIKTQNELAKMRAFLLKYFLC